MVKHHLAARLLLIIYLLIIMLSCSSIFAARPLNDEIALALPSDNRVEKEYRVGCGGKYGGAFIFNMLPKGTVPPSGPSKGTNNLNN